MSQKVVGLFTAWTYPLQALFLIIENRTLWVYVLVPILINLILGVTLYAGLLFSGFRAIDAIVSNLPHLATAASASASHLTTDITSSVSGWHPTFPSWLQWHPTLPNWLASDGHLSLPTWNLKLPEGALTWPGWLPSGHLALPKWQGPNWHVTLPTWTPQFPGWLNPVHWQVTLPAWISQLPEWGLLFLSWLVHFVLVVILLLVTGFIVLQFGVLLGSPWYGKLSEELEKLRTGQVKTIEVSVTTEISRTILYELKKLFLSIGVGLPLLVLKFIPGLGTAIAPIGGLTLATTIVCLDFLDAAQERRRLSFRRKLGNVLGSFPASGTFGLVCFGLVSIPFVNLLMIPICVAAGTLFFCDQIRPQLESAA
jgi:CysZ protein